MISGLGVLRPGLGFHDMGSPHTSIAIASFAVCVLVVSVLLISFRRGKIDYITGLPSIFKFVYASFLKPHDRDHGGEGGQQHALESFYKTQVGGQNAIDSPDSRSELNQPRPRCMMLPEDGFSMAGRTCSDCSRLSSSSGGN
jgi:hypothetical protein